MLLDPKLIDCRHSSAISFIGTSYTHAYILFLLFPSLAKHIKLVLKFC